MTVYNILTYSDYPPTILYYNIVVLLSKLKHNWLRLEKKKQEPAIVIEKNCLYLIINKQ